MFEFEVGDIEYTSNELDRIDLSQFGSYKGRLSSAALIQWEEHCSECAMPMCYKTCDLYIPRRDGLCRRFKFGIQPVGKFLDPFQTVVRIEFKRWGRLIGTIHPNHLPLQTFLDFEDKALKSSKIAASLPGSGIKIAGRSGLPSRIARRYKTRLLKRASESKLIGESPDSFLAEVFNPRDHPVELSFVVRNLDGPREKMPYQQLLRIEPGFNQIEIAFNRIASQIDTSRDMHVILHPNVPEQNDETIVMYFGFLSFAKLVKPMDAKFSTDFKEPSKKAVKVVVWDLDNTLWNGTLVEDGASGVRLNEVAIETVKALDARGIVNSIASKNDFDNAMQCLNRFQIDEYFVYPQISWMPKSQALKRIRESFNIGEETVAFVDDQPFERAEVREANPLMRIYDETDIPKLLERPEFNVPNSKDAASRRAFYRNQERRDFEFESFGGEYLEFLRACHLTVTITHPLKEQYDRVHELIQRTNQMNFSGTRYQRAELEAILDNDGFEHFCLFASDKFGDYGMVGFGIFERATHTLRELTFSCRVQSKRVEHAFLVWLSTRAYQKKASNIFVRFNQTIKNTAVSQVFDDLGFNKSEIAGDIYYSFDLSSPPPTQDIVLIKDESLKKVT